MLQYVSEYVLAAGMKHLAADWTKNRVVGGREDGGPDLADDSVNGVIINGPLSVQYKQQVTHQAKLLSSFLSSPTSVTFTHLLVFVFWWEGGWLTLTLPCVGEGGLCRSVCKWHTNPSDGRVPGYGRSLYFIFLLLCKFDNIS